MRFLLPASILVALLLTFGTSCSKGGGGGAEAREVPAAAGPSDEEARAFLTTFVSGSGDEIDTTKLEPRDSEYPLLFDDGAFMRAARLYPDLFDHVQLPITFAPGKPIEIRSASVSDIMAGAEGFGDGWRVGAKSLKKGLRVFAWRCGAEGPFEGGLVKVGQRWVLCFRPWLVIGDLEATRHPGTMAGAKKMLGALIDGTVRPDALARALRPLAGDLSSLFEKDVADRALLADMARWRDLSIAFERDPEERELRIWSATTEQIAKWEGDAADHFPGAYEQLEQDLKPGVTWYRFKFVEPGKALGTAYDGLVHVNGHWVWVPKPWRILR